MIANGSPRCTVVYSSYPRVDPKLHGRDLNTNEVEDTNVLTRSGHVQIIWQINLTE